MHRASRLLLNIGLNFNASKTKHYSRNEFREFRALNLIKAVGDKDFKRFERELRHFSSRYPTKGGRIDTVIKASLNLLSSEPKSRTLFAMNYLREKLKEYEFFSSLNEGQLIKKYLLFGDISKEMKRDVGMIIRHPYAAPRATFLSFLVKYKKRLLKEGVSQKTVKGLIDKIENLSDDSEITKNICIPAARKAYI